VIGDWCVAVFRLSKVGIVDLRRTKEDNDSRDLVHRDRWYYRTRTDRDNTSNNGVGLGADTVRIYYLGLFGERSNVPLTCHRRLKNWNIFDLSTSNLFTLKIPWACSGNSVCSRCVLSTDSLSFCDDVLLPQHYTLKTDQVVEYWAYVSVSQRSPKYLVYRRETEN